MSCTVPGFGPGHAILGGSPAKVCKRARGSVSDKSRKAKFSGQSVRGFSVLELLITVSVLLIVTAIAVPNFNTAMHAGRLKGAIGNFADIVQTDRIKSVDDDRYYSIYVLQNNGQEAYVDIYPQNGNGTSGNGGTAVNASDPVMLIDSEVGEQPVGSAPNTALLKSLLLPAASPVVPLDGSLVASPVTFGPRGLPCKPLAGVCDTLGGPQAYWTFFQDSVSKNWGAVTVTPAGRVQRWLYSAAGTGSWQSY